MSCTFPTLVTSHSEKVCHVWNLELIRNQQYNPVNVCESPLKFATSAICAFADGKGFAIGSIEGRCGIMNVNFMKQGKDTVDNDFCFKCHRNEQDSSGDVYTVNCISFNKKHNTFCTVGSDGTFIIWNKDTKSRYKMSKAAPIGMTACAFNDDATLLAFACGEDWTKGNEFAKQR